MTKKEKVQVVQYPCCKGAFYVSVYPIKQHEDKKEELKGDKEMAGYAKESYKITVMDYEKFKKLPFINHTSNCKYYIPKAE